MSTIIPSVRPVLRAGGLISLLAAGWLLAGEIPVEPADNDSGLINDTTADAGARSGDVTETTENSVEPTPAAEVIVEPAPVADAADVIVEPESEGDVAEVIVEPAPVAEVIVEPTPAAEDVVELSPAAEVIVEPTPAAEVTVEATPANEDVVTVTTATEETVAPTTAAEGSVEPNAVAEPDVPLADAVTTAEGAAAPLQLLGFEVAPASSARLSWSATELFEGVPVSTPVLVINGAEPGPTLCLTAAVHGDELNGIEMVRRVMHDISPNRLAGALIGVPIVNVQGFRRGSRYLPDRRDLNRYFPGNSNGSAAARIANSLFIRVISHCDALIDLHTGSFERTNLPQIRADLRNPDVVTLTQGFGATVILHSTPGVGTLRHAATKAGIPTVTLEAGGPLQLEPNEVKHGVKGIETLISSLGMTKRTRFWGDPEPVYYRSSWVRADSGGILLSDVSLGSTVRRGDLLGTITDPMNNARTELRSPFSGRIIGMARNQVVMPGFAAFHVGIQTDEATTEPLEAHDAVARDGEALTEDGAYIDGISE